MPHQTHKKILTLLLTISIILFTGCSSEEEPTKKDTPSQSEDSSNLTNSDNESSQDDSNDNSNNDNSSQEDYTEDINDNTPTQDEDDSSNDTTYGDKTEYHETFSERKLIINIDVPFEIGKLDRANRIDGQHSIWHSNRVNYQNKKILYYPDNKFVGEDQLEYRFYDKKNYEDSIKITYNIKIKKLPFEGSRDFTVKYSCQRELHHLKSVSTTSMDLDIVDNSLNRVQNIYDNGNSFHNLLPKKYTRIVLDYVYEDNPPYDSENAIKHHNAFKENLTEQMLITCNYHSGGNLRTIYPINSRDWEATQDTAPSYVSLSRNDLIFYASTLSELYTQIYLKEYNQNSNREEALSNASNFMDKIFPNSHYKGELRKKRKSLFTLFHEENKIFYNKLNTLADEITDKNILLLLQKIADNYKSYYMSGNKKCINSTICGTLFPEYTKSITDNPRFESGFNYWSQNNKVPVGIGQIDFFPTRKTVSIESSVHRPKGSTEDATNLALYQIESLNNSSIDDYFLKFELHNLYGGTTNVFAGYQDSGFTGIYISFQDEKHKQLAMMTWSDHLNKSFLFKGMIGVNTMENTKYFYNTELKPVVRRSEPNEKKYSSIIHLGNYLERHLPEVYNT